MIVRYGESHNISGVFQVLTEDGMLHTMRLPGTLAESSIGEPDEQENGYPILTRFTACCRYEGRARISKLLSFEERPGKRYLLEAERARSLTLEIDGRKVKPFGETSLSTPVRFETTGHLDGSHMLTFVSDNSYAGMPRESIMGSNAASYDTATNWNGILGPIVIREEEECFISSVTTSFDGEAVTVKAELSSSVEGERTVTLSCGAFCETHAFQVTVKPGLNRFIFGDLRLCEDAERWDTENGRTYDLVLRLTDDRRTREVTVPVGFRTLSRTSDAILLNGRKTVLRGETNRAVHPETGAVPTDAPYWDTLFSMYRRYGLNFVYFESHCPPDAAFSAADRSGIAVMVSLSRSGCDVSKEAKKYDERELKCILNEYGAHPSFIGVSFGANGTPDEEEAAYLESLYKLAVKTDPTRFYVFGTDTMSEREDLWLVTKKTAKTAAENAVRPLIVTDACRFETLPDFGEIDLFSGVLKPEQLVVARRAAEYEQTLPDWKRFTEASGEWQSRAYEEEIGELRSDGVLAGFTFYALQDHVGGNDRPTGCMFSHPVPKPYDFAKPERLFRSTSPETIVLKGRYQAISVGKKTEADVVFVNGGKEPVTATLLLPERENPLQVQRIASIETDGETMVAPGEAKTVGKLILKTDNNRDVIEEKTVTLSFGQTLRAFRCFLYPDLIPVCPENVLEVSEFTERAVEWMRRGGTVLFTPKVVSRELRRSGIVDNAHRLFQAFRSEPYFDERWRLFDACPGFELPIGCEAIVSGLCHPFDGTFPALLFEGRVAAGQFIASSLGLKEKMDDPAARTLLSDIYEYAGSVEFSPATEYEPDKLMKIIHSLS